MRTEERRQRRQRKQSYAVVAASQTKHSGTIVLTLKLSLLGVNSLDGGAFSSTSGGGGGDGVGGVLGVQA